MSGLTVLTAADVDRVIQDIDLEAALTGQSAVFQAYSSGSPGTGNVPAIQTPQRLSIQSEKATSLFMPARVYAQGTACKIVSVPKAGGTDGLPGTTLIMDDEGRIKGIVNARKLTALRNACGSALFLRSCPSNKPPTNLLIFGSGAQAHSHASVFVRLFPSINTIRLAVRSANDRAKALAETLSTTFPGVSVELVKTTENGQKTDLSAQVGSADIIVTVTSSTEALFPSEHVTAGTRLILIGSYTPKMREVDDALILRAGVIAVDSKEACGHEAGELLSAGIGADKLVELGALVAAEDARTSVGKGGDVVVFKSVGLGIQDVAIAKLVFDDALRRGLGTHIAAYDGAE